MANIVPDVSNTFVSSEADGPFEATESHVILLTIETAEAKVVENFAVIDTHLQ